MLRQGRTFCAAGSPPGSAPARWPIVISRAPAGGPARPGIADPAGPPAAGACGGSSAGAWYVMWPPTACAPRPIYYGARDWVPGRLACEPGAQGGAAAWSRTCGHGLARSDAAHLAGPGQGWGGRRVCGGAGAYGQGRASAPGARRVPAPAVSWACCWQGRLWGCAEASRAQVSRAGRAARGPRRAPARRPATRRPAPRAGAAARRPGAAAASSPGRPRCSRPPARRRVAGHDRLHASQPSSWKSAILFIHTAWRAQGWW